MSMNYRKACRKPAFGKIAGLALAVISAALLFGQTDSGIKGVVAGNARPELVQEGFMFTEGPVGMADGGLYFSDIMGADKTFRLDSTGKITLYRSNTKDRKSTRLNSSHITISYAVFCLKKKKKKNKQKKH